jgi:hypothetical protein
MGDMFPSIRAASGKKTENQDVYSPALQQTMPYRYADTSLETLFPLIQNQGGALSGLLGSQNTSSGAARFLSGFPVNDYMKNMTPQIDYLNTYIPSQFVMPTQDINQIVAQTRDNSPTGNMSMPMGGYGRNTNLGK